MCISLYLALYYSTQLSKMANSDVFTKTFRCIFFSCFTRLRRLNNHNFLSLCFLWQLKPWHFFLDQLLRALYRAQVSRKLQDENGKWGLILAASWLPPILILENAHSAQEKPIPWNCRRLSCSARRAQSQGASRCRRELRTKCQKCWNEPVAGDWVPQARQ